MTGSLFSQIVEHTIKESEPSAIIESVRLTKREKQIILLIANGATNREIGQVLHISIYTVKSHIHNILEKLALHTRVQIANQVHRSQLLQQCRYYLYNKRIIPLTFMPN